VSVLLIAADTEKLDVQTPPHGLGLVAASLKEQGFEVDCLDLLDQEDPHGTVLDALHSLHPDAIGISIHDIDDRNRQAPRFLLAKARDVVAACREASAAPIVLGGPGFSIFPREALAYLEADYGIRGDGEEAFPALLSCLRKGEDPRRIHGVLVAGEPGAPVHPAHAGLDSYPVWDDSQYGDPDDPAYWVAVQTRRGCANDCAYCATPAVQGRHLRCRSPREVVEGISILSRKGYGQFQFVDNTFNIPESLALEICQGLRPLAWRIRWRCTLYPKGVDDRLAHAMAAAGCAEVDLGFESGSPAILEAMNKHFTPDDVREAAQCLRDHGIRRRGFLLLGGPGETRETVEESLAFAQSLELDELKVTVGIRIYPDTELAQQAEREGILEPEADLLFPRFYLAPGLEPWIHERVAQAGY
jgi:radical SAM superfamily enzyme YgiQ (UPF0313 family)